MDKPSPDQLDFSSFATAIAPYLDQVVVAGGWAHRLHRLHGKASSVGFPALMTTDADVAATTAAAAAGPSIYELLRDAGFTEKLSGGGAEPVAKYLLRSSSSGFYVEFLTPVRGGGGNRRQGATEQLSGVLAQRLRSVDLLLKSPWQIQLTSDIGYPVQPDGLIIQVANPTTYLAQKLLVLPGRKPSERPKDILYIHDTILIFGGGLTELRELWQSLLPSIPGSTRKKLLRQIDEQFREPTDDIRRAAEIARRTSRLSPPSASELAKVCRLGLADIFQAE